jgi:shikimate dehydrogenase
MTLKLRAASIEDIETIVRLNEQVQLLHAELEPAHFKAETNHREIRDYFETALERQSNRFTLAEDNGRVIGYIWFQYQDRPETPFTFSLTRIYIHHIVVDEAARRRGVASALLAQACSEASDEGIDHIVLDTWAANSGAQSFFQAHGFTPLTLSFELTKPFKQ